MRHTVRGRRTGAVGIGIVLVIMLAIEAFALRAGTLGIVVIGLLAGLALIVAITGADLVKVGLGATYLSAFTLTWNGWFVGPIRPGDVLPLVGLLCFAVAAPTIAFRTVPWWIKQLAIGLVFLLVLLVLFPTSPHYLDGRNLIGAGGQAVDRNNSDLAMTNVAITAKFIIAIAAIPLCFAGAARIDRRAVRWLAIAFCTGSALSGLVAFIDHTGVASIGRLLTHLPPVSARTIGFSNHPNFLATGLVLSAPFACWLLTSKIRWEQRVGAISLVSMLVGVYASGSRGGTVCIVGAIGLAFILIPRTRPHIPGIALGAVAAVGVVAVAFPSVGLAFLRVTRLYGNATTSGSDTVRDLAAEQGIRDFNYSPFKGIGLQASTDASQVYIQQLAAGGLVLFVIMSVYVLGASWASFRMINRSPIAAAACAAILSTLALNFVEASLTDRFYYVPEAILVALLAVANRDRDTSTDDEFAHGYIPPGAVDAAGHLPDEGVPLTSSKETAVTRP